MIPNTILITLDCQKNLQNIINGIRKAKNEINEGFSYKIFTSGFAGVSLHFFIKKRLKWIFNFLRATGTLHDKKYTRYPYLIPPLEGV